MVKKTSAPLVSIITPSYEQAEFLEDCIQSVLNQDYPNLEYIVVDGGSQDGSLEIIKSYEKSLAWWVSEPDKGQADAINKGLAKANGEYVAWLNSDDMYKGGAISSAVRQLEARPDVAMVYGDLDSVNREGQHFHTIHYQQYTLLDLLSFRMIGQPSVFMRRKMLREVGFLDQEFHYLLDHQLWLRLAQQYPILYVPEVWAAARHHSGAKNRAQAAQFGQEAFRIIEWAKTQAASAQLVEQKRRKVVAGAQRLNARYLLEAGQPGKSMLAYLRALANNPMEMYRHWKRFLLATLSWLGLSWLRPAPYESRRPILVTGIHRSGTSWVGRMLNLSGRTAYISEPLNVLHRRGVMDADVPHWYTYISKDNANKFLAAFRETLKMRYKMGRELMSLRSDRDLFRMMRDTFVFLRGRIARQRPLLKDPFALFSLPWFIDELNCKVVIVVRHPAAAVSSLKRLGWHFDFDDLLAQPELMKDWLEPFRDDIEKAVRGEKDVIAQGALLWRMLYSTAHKLKEQYPHILLLRHEDFSQEPVKMFEGLYADLELPFNDKVRRGIRKSTEARNPSQLSIKSIYSTKLDSAANLHNWRNRLSQAEIEQIRNITEDIASLYYSDEEWA